MKKTGKNASADLETTEHDFCKERVSQFLLLNIPCESYSSETIVSQGHGP